MIPCTSHGRSFSWTDPGFYELRGSVGDTGNLSYGVPKTLQLRKDEQELVTPQNSYNATKYRNDYITRNLFSSWLYTISSITREKKCQLNCSNKQVSRLKKGRWLAFQSTSPASTTVVALPSEESHNRRR